MSAVRMVAYGVLEFKSVPQPDRIGDEGRASTYRQTMFERDQLMKLVNDELKRYGMLLAPKVRFGNRHGTIYVLYGTMQGTAAFPLRRLVAEGTFKACCIAASELLDAECPDATAGNIQ